MQRRRRIGGSLLLALAAVLVLMIVPLLGMPGSSSSPVALPSSPAPAGPSAPAGTGGASGGPTTPASPAPASGIPAFRHVYLIIMENHSYGSIIDSPSAPFLNSLVSRYSLAADYHSVASPSQPNYLALFSGSTQGVTDDGIHDLTGRNLADQLEANGRTWRVFAQNVPTGCFTGASADGGPDGAGTYARKHNPAVSFSDISTDPGRCARITDFSHFTPDAANFVLIVPNLCNDMHDCSVATGDAFLASFVPKITGSSAFSDSVLFITWDEGSGNDHVATLVVSPLVVAGTRSSVPHTHYALLRTVQEAWGLGCLAESCAANDLHELFAR